MALEQGDSAMARCLYQESLALQREVRDKLGIAVLLIGLGEIARAQEQLKRAARLLGAAAALLESIGAHLNPLDQTVYDRNVAAVQAVLGADQFAAVWAAGRAMTLEEAIADASGEGTELPQQGQATHTI